MNDEARELLVKAALEGHPQIRGDYHDFSSGGDCALGIFHRAMHNGQQCYHGTWADAKACSDSMAERFGLSVNDRLEIARRNDGRMGYEPHDFLTIARKACLPIPE